MKYLMFFNGDDDELYNIDTDIGETTNLLSQQPEVAKRLQQELSSYMRAVYPDLPSPKKHMRSVVTDRIQLSN
jgi:hypothetical protein